MITADAIEAVVADLQAGKIPDRDHLETFCQAWQRLRACQGFDAATGATGSIAREERNEALRAAISELDPLGTLTPWQAAEVLRKALRRPNLRGYLRDAARLGARDLGRKQLCEILKG